MAIYEQIVGLDILQKEFGRGVQKLKSVFPDTLHLLANWAMTIDNRVFLGQGTTKGTNSITRVPFGNVEMYPWPFRDGQSLDYVSIMPAIYPSGQIAADGRRYATANYCYAIEVILEKETSPNNAFSGYSGRGGFTMAYNPNVNTTPYYMASPLAPYPLFIYKDSNSQYESSVPVYITASLVPDQENENKFTLKFFINSFDKRLYFSIFECDVIIDSRNSFAKKREDGGISGLVDISSVSNNKSAFAIKDIQIISPEVEFESVSDVSISERRCEFIRTYAFPNCDILSNIILSQEDVKVDLNKYIFNSPYKGSGTNHIIALPQNLRNSSNQSTKTNIVYYSQPVQVTLQVSYEPVSTVRIIRQYDNTGRFIATLAGDISLKFPGKYTATLYADGDITWKYSETTIVTNDGMSFSRFYDLSGKMMAITKQASLYPESLLQQYSEELDALKSSSLLRGAVRVPTDKEFDDFKQAILNDLRSIESLFGILIPYVLYKPNINVINAEYNELLFLHGYIGIYEQIKNFLNVSPDNPNAQLIISSIISKMSTTINANKALRVPIALVGRVTQTTYLDSWNAFATIPLKMHSLGVELLI